MEPPLPRQNVAAESACFGREWAVPRRANFRSVRRVLRGSGFRSLPPAPLKLRQPYRRAQRSLSRSKPTSTHTYNQQIHVLGDDCSTDGRCRRGPQGARDLFDGRFSAGDGAPLAGGSSSHLEGIGREERAGPAVVGEGGRLVHRHGEGAFLLLVSPITVYGQCLGKYLNALWKPKSLV